MSGVRHHLDDDHLVELYRSGMTTTQIAVAVGATGSTVSRHLRARGVIRPRGERAQRAGTITGAAAASAGARAAERDRFRDDVCSRYGAGESVGSIARALNMSQPRVVRILDDAGIPRRDRSAAGRNRIRRDPAGQRASTDAAARANRGRVKPEVAITTAAATKEDRLSQNIGQWEDEVFAALSEAGYEVRRQVAVGRYNLDLAVDRLAVEVHTMRHGPHLDRFGRYRRVEHLRESGWDVLYVWCPRGVTAADMDKLVAHVEVLRLNPPAAGHYSVFRCRGEGRPARGANTYDGAFVVATRDV